VEKREKIMLGLMAATIVVAGGLYLTGPQSPVAGDGLKPGAQVNLDEVTKTLEQSKLPPDLAYRIGVLAENATFNPFYGEGGALSQDEGAGAGQGGAGEIVYSGYMKIGQKVYAVINGVEYARGDELAEGGYVVQGIEKSSVLLERTDGSTGRKFIKRVPLVEDDSDKIRIRVVKKR
jgi:hypothetical protein